MVTDEKLDFFDLHQIYFYIFTEGMDSRKECFMWSRFDNSSKFELITNFNERK